MKIKEIIKKKLYEAVGVPTNINVAAEKIFNDIINTLGLVSDHFDYDLRRAGNFDVCPRAANVYAGIRIQSFRVWCCYRISIIPCDSSDYLY